MKLLPKCEAVLAKLYEWNLDEEMSVALGFPSIPMDSNNCYNYFNDKYDGYGNMLIGVQGDSGEIHGCYLVHFNEKDRRVKMDIAFDKVGRGKLLIEATSKCFDYVFNERAVLSIYGEISVSNKLSYNFAKRIGFRDVCILPGYFNERGSMIDAHLIRLTNDNRSI